MKKFNILTVVLNMGVIVFFLIAAAGCNLPGSVPTETPGGTPSDSNLTDENAEPYRMFFNPAGTNTEDVQVRKFIGQIRLADLESIFGDLRELPKDEDGNSVADALLKDGKLWYLLMSPSGASVNLVSIGADGVVSSVIDANGDKVADIVDMRLPDGRRFTFLTEQVGLDIFEFLRNGLDPWCEPELADSIPGLEEGFGCGNEDDASGGEGGAGSSNGSNGFEDTGIVDPFDLACEGYSTGGKAGIMSRVRRHAFIRSARIQSIYREGSGDTQIFTQVHETYSGEYTHTTRIIREYGVDGEPISTTYETVYPDGHGHRSTQYHDTGDVQRLPREEEIQVKMDPDNEGQYSSNKTDPPYDNPHPEDAESSSTTEVIVPRVSAPESGGSQGDPGPEGDDSSLADFCARRGAVRSGAEDAASRDPSSIGVSCDDLVGAPSAGDCTIIEWARPEDFTGAIDRSGGDSCGDLYTDDGTGHCEPTSIIEKLRGRTAEILSMQLGDVAICGGLVCRPPDVSIENQQPVSLSYQGTATDTVLCYQGPGDGYPVISSVNEDVEVEILGVGIEKGWYVIDSPVFPGFPCWISENSLLPDENVEPETLPVISIPVDRITVPDSGGTGSDSSSGSGGEGDGGGGDTPSQVECGPDEYFSIITQSCEPFG